MAVVDVNGPTGHGHALRSIERCLVTRRWGVLRSPVRLLVASAVSLFALLASGPAALAIDEFPLTNPCSAAPTGGTCQPGGITTGPDGALWFTEEHGNRIGRITTSGAITEYTAGLSAGAAPVEITPGPGGLWFTESGTNRVAQITTGGTITEHPVGASPDGIAAGPDGHIWFTEPIANRIGRFKTDGSGVEHFTLSSCPCEPGDITLGPDRRLWFTEGSGNRVRAINPLAPDIQASIQTYQLPNAGSDPSGITSSGPFLWFAEFGGNRIGRLNTNGQLDEFAAGSGQPSGIAAGSDGALWFTETSANRIGRMTTGGALTNEFNVPTPSSQPGDVTAGPDGALWFTELVGNKIGRIAVAPPFVPPPPPPVVSPTASAKKKCKVPKLKGLTVKKARSKLKKAGCKYKIRGKGRVRSTSPKAGTRTTKRVTVKCKAKRKKARR